MSEDVLIGVDGGGTKTVACVVDREGNLLGRGTGGPSNWNSVGKEKARQALEEAILNSIKDAKTSIQKVKGICLGMAGVDRPEDKTIIIENLKTLLPTVQNPLVYNDGVVALSSGTRGHLFGVVIISGTGMICLGYNNETKGEPVRSGGWGPLLGDEGSGYAIGSDLLNAVVRAVDGRGTSTILVERVLQHLHLSKPEQLIEWTYKDLSWQRIAALSQLVFEAEKLNDVVATRILHKAANGLFEAIQAVTQRLHFSKEDTFPLVFAGGNLTHSGSRLAQLLSEKLNALYPKAQIIIPNVEPVMGAAYLAVQHYHGSFMKNEIK